MIYNESIKLKDFVILIKANDEYLISINVTNLKSIKDKPNHITNLTKCQLQNYFKCKRYDFSNIKLDLSSFSAFGQNVFSELQNIPHATTISYKELAFRINSRAFRAIGTVLSKNPYLIILPCHRVIRSDASLGRFTCEVANMKEFLNKHEQKFSINNL